MSLLVYVKMDDELHALLENEDAPGDDPDRLVEFMFVCGKVRDDASGDCSSESKVTDASMLMPRYGSLTHLSIGIERRIYDKLPSRRRLPCDHPCPAASAYGAMQNVPFR